MHVADEAVRILVVPLTSGIVLAKEEPVLDLVEAYWLWHDGQVVLPVIAENLLV